MTENKTVTILARYSFSDAEVRQIALKMAGSASEYTSTEAEFASVKADFKAKLERIELDRDTLTQKIRDGFEMRNTPAIVSFNDPSPGRKSFYRFDTEFSEEERAEIAQSHDPIYFIREEAMDATDFQRDLPLEEKTDLTGETHAFVPPMVCCHGVPINEPCGECNGDAQTIRDGQPINPERFPETGDSAKEVSEARDVIQTAGENIGTSIGDLLDQTAQGKRPNPVVIDFAPKDDGNKCLAKWRKAARNQGWPEPCIDLIDGITKDAAGAHSTDGEGTTKSRMLSVLHAHSISTEDRNREHDIEIADIDENERLASTFGNSEGGQ